MARTGIDRRPLLGLALLAPLVLPGAARAHSEVRHSTPAEGSVLGTPPTEIALTFTEPMQVSSLRLLDAAGRETPLRREGGAPRTAQVGAIRASILGAAPLPPGEYRIEYRGISADGHVGGGTVRFRVGAGAAATR